MGERDNRIQTSYTTAHELVFSRALPAKALDTELQLRTLGDIRDVDMSIGYTD